jgi:nucleotide-binding universal stress UspA family protein
MIQILVPTDLTLDARPGIRFSVQWSKQEKVHLTFAYVLYIPRLTRWNDAQYKRFALSERERAQRALERMIADIYRQMGQPAAGYTCEVIEGVMAETSLLDYCRVHPEIDQICMGTHGATGISQLFGTHAGNILAQSGIPVVVVPKGYRTKPIISILFASELRDYEEELDRVAVLARRLKASLTVLHIKGIEERTVDEDIIGKVLSDQCDYPVRVRCVLEDETRSMATNLRKQIHAIRPSLAVLFTRQERTIFEKMFLTSTAERLAFGAPVPLLVSARKTVHDEVHSKY